MSLFIKSDPNIERPKDAVVLRRDQVGAFYAVVVDTWKSPQEIWALTWGPKILGVAGALSGLYGSMYFRRKLRLTTKGYGAISTYIPNLLLPFLLTQSAHQVVIDKFQFFYDFIKIHRNQCQ